MKQNKNVDDLLLETFLYFCSIPQASKEDKCSMFERLVCCWQDQNLSFPKLESFLLASQDKSLLNIIIMTLFCPEKDENMTNGSTDDGPCKR